MNKLLVIWIGGILIGWGIHGIILEKEIKTLNAALSYSDLYIWKHCRYNFVSKEDFEEWKMNRREIAESQKGN